MNYLVLLPTRDSVQQRKTVLIVDDRRKQGGSR